MFIVNCLFRPRTHIPLYHLMEFYILIYFLRMKIILMWTCMHETTKKNKQIDVNTLSNRRKVKIFNVA